MIVTSPRTKMIIDLKSLRKNEVEVKKYLRKYNCHTIVNNRIRRLKTSNSERVLPLVGYAKVAMKLALKHADGHCLYPRYLKDGTCRASHASNALGKWLKKDFGL